jgi:predicted nucleotidyltransferase
MHKTGLTANDLQQILLVLKQSAEVEQAVIFGSRAKGNFKTGSDVDLALKGKNLSPEAVTHIAYLLNEETLLPYSFDVVKFETINSTELTEHINRVGIRIYPQTNS